MLQTMRWRFVIVALLLPRAVLADPVTFRVDTPYCTPQGSTILLRSNRADSSTFVHDPMTQVGPHRWEVTVDVTIDRSLFGYKYAHAVCDTTCIGIEKAITFTGSGGELEDRTVSSTVTEVDDYVYIWRDALTTFDNQGTSTGVRPDSDQVAFCGPYLSISDADEVTIGYDSYYGGDVSLEYGTSTNYGATLDHTAQFRNRFALTGLTPGQTYHYRIVEDGVPGIDQTFVAPMAPGEPFRFAVYGDTQFYGEQQRIDHQTYTDLMRAFDPHLVLSVGDMVASESGTTGPGGWAYPEMGRWNIFFGVAAPVLAAAPFMVVMGNHEEDAPYFWDVFQFPETDPGAADHYDFRYGHVHFTMLYTGSTDGYSVEGMLDSQTPWMESTLQRVSADPSIKFKIVLLHRGPYSEGASHTFAGDEFYLSSTATRPSWRDLWQQYGVDLVLAGHNHNFTLARGDDLYFYTACSGAPVHGLRTDTGTAAIHAESRCTANLFEVGRTTISLLPLRADGSTITEAAISLCHAATDCDELPSVCPAATEWDCIDNACSKVGCVDPPDAGFPDADPIDSGTVDVGFPDADPIDVGSPDAGATPDAVVVPDSGGKRKDGDADCSCDTTTKKSSSFLLLAALLLIRRKR